MSIRDAQEVSGGKTQRALPKKGPRPAVLVGIIDVGIQQGEYQGKPKKPCREIVPIFELVKDSYETEEGDTHNMKISPFPMGLMPGAEKSKYYKLIQALDPEHKILDDKGRGDITKLLGCQCMVNVGHKDPNAEGIVYPTIVEVTQLPEDYPVPDAETEFFFFDSCEPTPETVEFLTSYHKDVVRKSLDYIGSKLEAVVEGSVSAVPAGTDDDEDDSDDAPI